MWAQRVQKEEMPAGQEEKTNCLASLKHDANVAWQGTKHEYVHFFEEIKDECTPSIKPTSYYQDLAKNTFREWVHIPYFPAFHRPGWLLRYIFGPYDTDWISLFVAGMASLLKNRIHITHVHVLFSLHFCRRFLCRFDGSIYPHTTSTELCWIGQFTSHLRIVYGNYIILVNIFPTS